MIKVANELSKERNSFDPKGEVSILNYSDFVALIGHELGPTEQQICDQDLLDCANVLVSAQLAYDTAEAEYTGLHNGIGDAFRHGYWQGLSASGTSIPYAEAFGDAHEIDYPGPLIEHNMDYWNNGMGRLLGYDKWFTWTVKAEIEDGIENGEFMYINNGSLTPTDE